MHQEGSKPPGASGKSDSVLETGALPCPARDAAALASGALPRVLEAQIQGELEEAEADARDHRLDQGNGSKQPNVGSRAHSR